MKIVNETDGQEWTNDEHHQQTKTTKAYHNKCQNIGIG